jgi:hypothetical protein
MSDLLDLDLEDSSAAAKDGLSKSQRIEQAILLMADAVWAVVGLFLWIPQIVRVVITSALRLIHATLTRQPTDSIRGPIRQVSRFYIDGFLTPGQRKSPGGYGSRQLQLGRFLTETVWVIAVWLGVLRLVRPEAFRAVWQFLTLWASRGWDYAVGAAISLTEALPEDLRALGSLGPVASSLLALSLVIVLVGGFLLGRRRR